MKHAEILRLARVLGAEPAELEPLADASEEDLRALRDEISDQLLERSRRGFERSVALANHIPAALSAKLAQHAMGPVLAARAAGLLEPRQAAGLARHLPAEFLADISAHADLRRLVPLLDDIPLATMREVGAILARREEWIVLGAFVGHVQPAQLAEIVPVFDGRTLLQAGFMVEDPAHLDGVLALLSDERVDEILAAAARTGGWTEAVALFAHLGTEQADRILAALERLPPEAQDSLAARLRDDPELRDVAGPMADRASPELRARLEGA